MASSKRSPVYWIIAIVVVVVLFVPCVGVIAAIAVPGFIGYMRSAKTSEAERNVAEIRTHLERYRAEFGRYPTDLPANPSGPPGPERRLWETRQEWRELGFLPDGPVYYVYEVDTSDDGTSYVIHARGNLDGDSIESLYELSSASPFVTRHNPLD